MFRPLPAPKTFEGFDLAVFKQGRSNLAERKLTRPHLIVAPHLAKMGLFLPAGGWAFNEEGLRQLWQAHGAPTPQPFNPATEVLHFGQALRVNEQPFTGFDDIWLGTPGTLNIAYRKAPDPATRETLLASFAQRALHERAEALLQDFLPRIPKAPARIVVRPLHPRTLGQCTHDGEIRLNPTLHRWPDAILAETLAHELTHLTHFNHSPAFWRDLTLLLPDWLPRSLAHYL